MRAPTVLAAATLVVVLTPTAPVAQPADPAPVTLRLLGQPVWHAPDSRLGLRIAVTNDSEETIDGFRLSIAAYDRVETRSELQNVFSVDPTVQVPSSSFPKDHEATLAPGSTVRVNVRERLSTLVTFAGAKESGAYPLTISPVTDAGIPLGDPLTTAVLFYPDEPDPRLNLVPVLALNDVASRAPDGEFHSVGGTPPPLISAIAPDGWLSGLLEALHERAGRQLHLGLAPAPRLVEELNDLAGGFRTASSSGTVVVRSNSDASVAARHALDEIRSLLAIRGVQPLLTPYAFPDLPQLAGEGIERVAVQLNEAIEALEPLGAKFPRRWIFPPAGRLDSRSLGVLQDTARGTADRSFFSHEVLEQPLDPSTAGCPSPSPSFTCPVEVRTLDVRSVGYQTDPVIQELLGAVAEPGNDRLDIQRVLAETAMVREELPGVQRVIQITIPSSWHPAPRTAALFFKALATAPWLTTLSPNQGLNVGLEPALRVPLEPVPGAPLAPEDAFYDEIQGAAAVVESLADLGPPAQLVQRLRRNVLMAYSRNWWASDDTLEQGLAYARETEEETRRHLANVTVVAAPETTFTSRRGEIQLLLSNDNPYPVEVSIRVRSPDVRLENNGVITQVFPPQKATPVTLEATARRSGIFQVQIRLVTPHSGDEIAPPAAIAIRSTELNRVALGLTLGAFLFLIVFYLLRGMTRRPHRDTGDAPEPTSA